ncbi:hypothetical protein ABZ896_10705 [Streptomyces sp. NPDC047072]|uniref:hypothetical protein n=1 Tax=Streptomyces sp. NPDC047072 TaxID=3154809 RepID=UPI0033D8169D
MRRRPGESAVRRLLAELTRAHLRTQREPGLFTTHDPLRTYAGELSRWEDSPAAQAAVVPHRRLLDDHLGKAGGVAYATSGTML